MSPQAQLSAMLAVYLGLMALSVLRTFFRRKTADGFVINNRKTGRWGIMCASIVQIWDGNGFILCLLLLAGNGFGIWWFLGGVLLGNLWLYLTSERINSLSHRGKARTAADPIRLGGMGAPAWYLFLLVNGIVLVMGLGVNTKVMGTILSAGYGISMELAVFLVVAATMVCMALTGYRALLNTNKLEFAVTFMVCCGGFLLAPFAPGLDLSAGRILSDFQNTPVGMGPTFTIIAFVLNARFLDTIQVVESAISPKIARQGIGLGILALAVVYVGLTLLGLSLRILYPEIFNTATLADALSITAQLVTNTQLPVWLHVGFVLAILALGMSSLISHVSHAADFATQALGINPEKIPARFGAEVFSEIQKKKPKALATLLQKRAEYYNLQVARLERQDYQRMANWTRIMLVLLSLIVWYVATHMNPNIFVWVLQSLGLMIVSAPFIDVSIFRRPASRLYPYAMFTIMLVGYVTWLMVFIYQTQQLNPQLYSWVVNGLHLTGPLTALTNAVGAHWVGLLPFGITIALLAVFVPALSQRTSRV